MTNLRTTSPRGITRAVVTIDRGRGLVVDESPILQPEVILTYHPGRFPVEGRAFPDGRKEIISGLR
jgi:hypothetical protein